MFISNINLLFQSEAGEGQMMVDKTGVGPDSEGVVADPESGGDADEECGGDDADTEVKETSTLNRDDSLASTEKSPAQR